MRKRKQRMKKILTRISSFFLLITVWGLCTNAIAATDSFDDDFDADYEPIITSQPPVKINDPFEKINRKIYSFNEFILKNIAKPLNDNVYSRITTQGMRNSISNVMFHLKKPLIFVNYVLQGDFRNSVATLYSFAVNSIYGVGGIYRVAESQGVEVKNTDLNATLAKYHVPAGPFIMLPFLGPSSIRDALTFTIETLSDPLGTDVFGLGKEVLTIRDSVVYTKGTLYVVDKAYYVVDNFYDILSASFDPYILVRDTYIKTTSR